MFSNLEILGICASCRKRKLFIYRGWIKPKHLPRVQSNNKMCRKCLKLIEKAY